MATKKEKEDLLLIEHDIDPATLSPDERAAKLAELQQVPPKPPLRYFKTSIAGLSIVVAPPSGNAVAPQTVRFEPFLVEGFGGLMNRVGYLATSDARAIKKCEDDSNVTEVDQEEYDVIVSCADDPSNKKANRSSY